MAFWVPEEAKYGPPEVIVLNASVNPVFDCAIQIHTIVRTVPAGSSDHFEDIGWRGSVPPGQVAIPVNETLEGKTLVLAFTDSEGRRWKRFQHRLAKHEPPDALWIAARRAADEQIAAEELMSKRRSRWWRW